MNRTELIEAVVEDSQLSKNEVTKVVNSLFNVIGGKLQLKEKVQIFGFGNFEVRDRKAKKGRNPQTGVEVDIPASSIPAFKPAKALREKVN